MEETVNRHLEKYQTPYWKSHHSLIGWCGMNYPSVIMNQRLRKGPEIKDIEYNINFLHQKRSMSSSHRHTPNILARPLTGSSKQGSPTPTEKATGLQKGYKTSTHTLTTTPFQQRSVILNEMFKEEDTNYFRVKPINCELPPTVVEVGFSKKVLQVGEIKYNNRKEDERLRHLKKLSNSIITEQSLREILNPTLRVLNLEGLKWVKNEHINKIGYLATNLVELNIAGSEINDLNLVEVGKSCHKLLSIDISSCLNLSPHGLIDFLNLKPELTKFWSANNSHIIADESVISFKKMSSLYSLNLEFCITLTDKGINCFAEAKPPIRELYLSGCTQLTSAAISNLIAASGFILKTADFSLLTQKEFTNDIMKYIGNCPKLVNLNISGSSNITEDGFSMFTNDYSSSLPGGLIPREHNSPKVLKNLTDFRMSGFRIISDSILLRLTQVAPMIEIFDLNGMEKLTESVLSTVVRELQYLQLMTINFTEAISEAFLADLRKQYPNVKFIRTVVKYSNPADNGLRMPWPFVRKAKKSKGKKGDKKKKQQIRKKNG